MDIHTKMKADALEEIDLHCRIVEKKSHRLRLIRDDIQMLRADATLISQKLRSRPTQRGNAELRQLLLDIEQLDRDLRVAQQYESKALRRLEYIVEEKHVWIQLLK